MRSWLFALTAVVGLAFTHATAAQNAGINREFGTNGIASLRDPTNPNARFLGLGACAGPANTLNVVAASTLNQLTMFRLRPNGDLDTTFGNGLGFVHTTVPPSGEDTAQAACQSDGRILITRMAPGLGNDKNIQLIRLNADGTLDTGFAGTGSLTVDHDQHVVGLGDLEFPLGLNIETDGSISVSTRIFLADGQSRPGLVRVSSSGVLALVRVYQTLPGITPVYATAAGLGPDGRIWLVGGGNPTGTPFNSWFRAELNPANGDVIEAFVGTDGNYVVDGGRVLTNGIMVIVGKYVPQSQPGGAYQPRLLVFRDSGASHVALPMPFPVNSFEPTLAPFPGHGVAIPIAGGRVLFGAPLGAQNGEYELATYAAVVELGATAAGDRVDTRFGTNGSIQFAYRTPAPCTNGSPTLQRPVRFSNWLGRPVLAGIHATTCSVNPRNAFAARLLTPDDLFTSSFD
ncbi:MAG: hypothetical protein AMXMBFR59_41890 [Rhodanobacteraceae bacterium]